MFFNVVGYCLEDPVLSFAGEKNCIWYYGVGTAYTDAVVCNLMLGICNHPLI